MTAEKFLKKRNIVQEGKSDLIIGFDNGTKESLTELLESYHQHKLKELLPNDEEIEVMSDEYAKDECSCYSNDFNGFNNGVKWLKDKILKG